MDVRVFKRLNTYFCVFIGNNEDNFLKNEFNIKEAEYDWIHSFNEVSKELTVDLPRWTLKTSTYTIPKKSIWDHRF